MYLTIIEMLSRAQIMTSPTSTGSIATLQQPKPDRLESHNTLLEAETAPPPAVATFTPPRVQDSPYYCSAEFLEGTDRARHATNKMANGLTDRTDNARKHTATGDKAHVESEGGGGNNRDAEEKNCRNRECLRNKS
jgi:hypothetical protein